MFLCIKHNTHLFRRCEECREQSDQRTQHLHLQLYARVSKQLSLRHYYLSSFCLQPMYRRDIQYMCKISCCNEQRSCTCIERSSLKMKIEMKFIVSTCMEYTIGAINIHQEKKTKLYLLSEKYILCIHVGRPPTRKRCIQLYTVKSVCAMQNTYLCERLN